MTAYKILTPTVLTYIKVVLIVAVVPAIVGFVVVLAERRLMGFMQVRLGPNRVGPKGTLQGLADLVKLVTKEDVTPARAEKMVNLARICERYGGGGHARVGAISFEPEKFDTARVAAREIVDELRASYREQQAGA